MKHDVLETTLPNGMRVLLLERHGAPVVASMLWYSVGSRDERTGETGLSHFLEHMMFKGTDRYAKGEIDRVTTKLGGRNNAFTSNDLTAYYFVFAADRWEAALDIERSRMKDCLLDPAEFQAEKSVVLEELSMGKDEPWSVLYETVETLSYQVHPYHHPVIGWREDLEQLKVEDMSSYYARHYGPNRACMVVAGAIDAAATQDRIRNLFGDLPASAEERAPVLAEPDVSGERRAVVRYPGTIRRVAVAVPTCRMGADDDFALDAIAQILAGSRNSRLYQRLVIEAQVATSISAYNDVRLDRGLFWFLAELRDGAEPALAEALLRDELDRFLVAGPTAAELARAKTQLVAHFLFEEESAFDLANRLGRFEMSAIGGYRLIDSVDARYEALTSREVRDVARRYLVLEKSVIAWSLPEAVQPAKVKRRRKAAPKKTSARATSKKPGPKKAAAKKAKKRPAKKAARKKASTKPARGGSR